MAIEVAVKKWGNSIGILLPNEMVEKERLKVNERVLIEVVKKADLSKLFGSLKRKMPGQKFKDMVRKGWQI